MAKYRIKKSRLRRKDHVELTENVGPIPKGVYVFKKRCNGFYHLELPQAALIGVSRINPNLKKVENGSGSKTISPAEFLQKYQALLSVAANEAPDKTKRTYCLLLHDLLTIQPQEAVH